MTPALLLLACCAIVVESSPVQAAPSCDVDECENIDSSVDEVHMSLLQEFLQMNTLKAAGVAPHEQSPSHPAAKQIGAREQDSEPKAAALLEDATKRHSASGDPPATEEELKKLAEAGELECKSCHHYGNKIAAPCSGKSPCENPAPAPAVKAAAPAVKAVTAVAPAPVETVETIPWMIWAMLWVSVFVALILCIHVCGQKEKKEKAKEKEIVTEKEIVYVPEVQQVYVPQVQQVALPQVQQVQQIPVPQVQQQVVVPQMQQVVAPPPMMSQQTIPPTMIRSAPQVQAIPTTVPGNAMPSMSGVPQMLPARPGTPPMPFQGHSMSMTPTSSFLMAPPTAGSRQYYVPPTAGGAAVLGYQAPQASFDAGYYEEDN